MGKSWQLGRAALPLLLLCLAGCQQEPQATADAAAGAPAAAIPDLYNSGFGWISRQANVSPPPAGTPGAHGPVGDHPDFPHYANNSGRPPTLRIGDDTSPLLQPWAAAKVREANEKVHAGGVPFTASNRCWPAGVPGVLGLTAEPVVFFQTPKEVTIIYQRNQTVRHIYLNEEHPADLKPSWLGHSVGHYEGDTLVVDTIGLNDKTYMDNFPIPHSEQLHVIERYRIVPGSPDLITDMPRPNDDERFYKRPESQVLQVLAWIEDPGAFTEPFTQMQLYEPEHDGGLDESICQAGELEDHFNQGLVPVPMDDTPDF